MDNEPDVWTAILASSRMPWAGGPPVEFRGRHFLDGGMAAPVPVDEALAAGATHVLALQTRPFGVARKSSSRLGDRFIERHLRGLNPALVTLYRARLDALRAIVGDIARRTWTRLRTAVRARDAPAARHAVRRPARARQAILARRRRRTRPVESVLRCLLAGRALLDPFAEAPLDVPLRRRPATPPRPR